jgi:hypothetical protein
MADEKVTQKVTAPVQAAKKFMTTVEEAPKPKAPAVNEKTRAEQAAGRAALAAYNPVHVQED